MKDCNRTSIPISNYGYIYLDVYIAPHNPKQAGQYTNTLSP